VKRAILLILVTLVIGAWLTTPPDMLPFRARDERPADPELTRARLAALARAQVLIDAKTPRKDPENIDDIQCRYLYTRISGTTPKFDCALDDGERIRVKYGSPEVHAQVAATELLAALGFGADDVSMARRVRCYGCPHWPFLSRLIAERLHVDHFLEKHVDYDRYSDFEWVAVERRDQQKELKFGKQEGWSWYELSSINAAAGGAAHAEVDAFRLMAMFLNHWDNKPSNQQLICGRSCDHPITQIKDAGSTFGPRKVDLHAWSDSPFWADAASCTISMKHLPYGGGTFPNVSVSEEGRRILADRLIKLTASQLTALFTNARFDDVDGWVAAFERRVDAIAHRPPCPSTT